MQLTHSLLLALSAAATLSLASFQPTSDTAPSPLPAAAAAATTLPSGLVPAQPDAQAAAGAFAPPSAAGSIVDVDGAAAGPAIGPRSQQPQRARFCQHAHGKGACQNMDVELKRCYNFLGWWDNRVSSVYVNAGYRCYLYDGRDCQGLRKVEVRLPGIADLKAKWLNDRASSLYCFR